MTVYAYLRVSTEGQELAKQKLAILEYAHKNKIQIDEFIEIQVSSRKSMRDRLLDELLSRTVAGDTLIITELSRIGRSISQILTITNDLLQKNVRLISLKEAIDLTEKNADIRTKVLITLFGLFAEIERDLISQRTKEGIAQAHKMGKKSGRRKGVRVTSRLDGKEEQIIELWNKGIPQSNIARILEVGLTTLLHFLKSRNIKLPERKKT